MLLQQRSNRALFNSPLAYSDYAEPYGTPGLIRLAGDTVGRPDGPGPTEPTAATVHILISAQMQGIPANMFVIGAAVVIIFAPLPYIAQHVIQTVSVGFKRPHRGSEAVVVRTGKMIRPVLLSRDIGIPAPLGGVLAPIPLGGGPGPSRELPFRFRG